MLASLPGISDLSMTTNGLSLKALARELKEAGLKRVNISLDTLRPERFRAITRNGSLRAVLDGIEAALEAGLEPVKLNVVAIKGVNDDELPDLARMSLERNLHIRFIELMPFVDLPYIPSGRVKGLIERALGRLEPAEPPPGSGPARYYRLPGARGTIGFISPLSGEHFCDACNRLRLTAEGRLRPCLLTDIERDIRPALRAGASKEELKRLIRDTVGIKPERHPLGRGVAPGGRRMVEIGG
jgi:cyclic pyranopterin phosphate synthase